MRIQFTDKLGCISWQEVTLASACRLNQLTFEQWVHEGKLFVFDKVK